MDITLRVLQRGGAITPFLLQTAKACKSDFLLPQSWEVFSNETGRSNQRQFQKYVSNH